MDIFEDDLPEDEIANLQADQERKLEEDRLRKRIEKRKREMDKRNRKVDRKNNRSTGLAKSMMFETSDRQRFMIMNRQTFEKVDAPQESVMDFVVQARNRVKRQSHLPC